MAYIPIFNTAVVTAVVAGRAQRRTRPAATDPGVWPMRTSPPSPTQPAGETRPGEVTIGILTALPAEAAAMLSLIDDAAEFRDPDDPGLYHIGRLPSTIDGRPHVVAQLLMPRD